MRKLFLAAAVIIAAIVAGTVDAQAQIKIPPGDQIVCVFECHGLIFIVLEDGTVIETPGNATGDATLESLGDDDPSHPANTAFRPVAINVTGNSGSFGDFNFTFDVSRPVSNATVYATQDAIDAGAELPAVSDVYANVSGTIEGLPGTFTNTTECHMQATINSFNPHNHEVYTFVNDVVFTDDDPDGDGRNVTFTIPRGATVTLH